MAAMLVASSPVAPCALPPLSSNAASRGELALCDAQNVLVHCAFGNQPAPHQTQNKHPTANAIAKASKDQHMHPTHACHKHTKSESACPRRYKGHKGFNRRSSTFLLIHAPCPVDAQRKRLHKDFHTGS